MKLLTWVASTLVPALLLNECSELSPWLARKVIKAGAHLLLERDQVVRYEEEWLAGLDGTPGKLTVLLKALGIVFIAVPRMNWDYFDYIWSCTIGLRAFTYNIHRGLRWPRYLQWSEETRTAAHQYNTLLSAACRILRKGSPTARANVLHMVEDFVENPPLWVTMQPFGTPMLKAFVGRDLPHFKQSLRRRGLLAQGCDDHT